MFKCPSLVNSLFEREIWKGNFGRIQFLTESKVISESDEVDEIVTKNRTPSTVES